MFQGNRIGRLPQVDALRGLAAAAVMSRHYLAWEYGATGVVLFFLISGFVIFKSIEGRTSLGQFALARFARLFPVFWAAMATTVCVMVVAGQGDGLSFSRIAANATMVDGAIRAAVAIVHPADANTFNYIDGSYWTLEFELAFYALAGFVVLGCRIRRPEWPCLAWLALTLAVRLSEPISPLWNIPALLLTQFAECFVLGVMIYKVVAGDAVKLTWLAAAVAFLISLLDRFGGSSGLFPVTLAIYAALLFVAANGLLRPLEARPMVFLGRISYALYLAHNMIGHAIGSALEPFGVPLPLQVVVQLVAVLLIATALTFLVEIPAQRGIIAWKRAQQRASMATSQPNP